MEHVVQSPNSQTGGLAAQRSNVLLNVGVARLLVAEGT